MLSGAHHGRIAVFAGPSLPADRRPRDPRLAWIGPAQAGDGLILAGLRPAAVVLLDGVFDETPSIRHKELLALLAHGIPVFGAASMGALRAAELHPFGMKGIGRIFAAFARGQLTADDEVALAHAPAELGWRALSEPLVNVRATLVRAARRKALTLCEARRLLEAARRVFYRDRTWDTILALAPLRAERTEAFRTWLVRGHVDLKRIDALECIDAALAAARPAPEWPAPPLTMFTLALAKDLAAAGW